MEARRPWKYTKLAKAFHRQNNYTPYTMLWNPTIDSDMIDPSFPKEIRLLFAIRRDSWGNLSEWAVSGMPQLETSDPKPKPRTQKDYAGILDLAESSISIAVNFWKERGYLKKDHPFLFPEKRILETKDLGMESKTDSIDSTSLFVRFRKSVLSEDIGLGSIVSKLEAERKEFQEEARRRSQELHKIELRILGLWREKQREVDSMRSCATAQQQQPTTDETTANQDNISTKEYNGVDFHSKPELVSDIKPRPETRSKRKPLITNDPKSAPLNTSFKLESKRGTTTTIEATRPETSSSSPSQPIQSLPMPLDFRQGLAKALTEAGKPQATRAQIAAAYIQTGERWQEFISWIGTSDEFRRMGHPGGLPTLIGYFLETEPGQQPQRRPQSRAEESRAQSIALMEAIDRMKGRRKTQ